MPRPKSREGNSEQLCIKVSVALLEEIDAARGEQSRPDWGRAAFLAALSRKPDTSSSGIKAAIDDRQPPGTGTLAIAKPEVAPKNCKHPNFRGVKGVCPDCCEWVAGKPRT